MSQISSLEAVGSIIIFLVILVRFLGRRDNPREPPAVHSSIPLIGHLIGMMRHKMFYYQVLRDRFNVPIFSVPMLGSKIYVVTSPRLITAVQRNTVNLSFEPIAAKFSQRMSGCSDEANKIIEKSDMVASFFKEIPPTLKPGRGLDAMNRIMIQYIGRSVDNLASGPSKTINLCNWLRQELTMATTVSVYGPGNPFADPEVGKAFWTFEANLMSILINVFPSITAQKAIKARSFATEAFYRYFCEGSHNNGSEMAQTRYKFSRRHGVPVRDIAAFEVGNCLGLLSNTFPTAYWMLSYIFSHPDVLQDCREEVAKITTSHRADDGTTRHSIDMSTFKSSCPVIIATLQEVLRHTAIGSTVREVMEDCTLDVYFLKKGNTLLTPANVLHTDPNIWGSDLSSFDHRRFLRAPGKKVPNPVAFRGFGGGHTLCPGRHFATTEILAMATVLISRFDMKPIGKWPEPDRACAKFWTQILDPNPDFQVELSEREGVTTQDKWIFSLRESEIVLAMAAEDLDDPPKN